MSEKKFLLSFLISSLILIGNIYCTSSKNLEKDETSSKNKIQPSSLYQNDYVFDLADITAMYQDKYNYYKLEAYRIKENDKILQDKDPQRYMELKWVSYG